MWLSPEENADPSMQRDIVEQQLDSFLRSTVTLSARKIPLQLKRQEGPGDGSRAAP